MYIREEPNLNLFFVVGCFVAGLISLILSEINTCNFNTHTGQFTLKRQNLLGTKEIQHRLSEIVGVEIGSYSGERITYRVEIVLSSSQRVPLTNNFSSDYEGRQNTASLIRRFLRLSTT